MSSPSDTDQPSAGGHPLARAGSGSNWMTRAIRVLVVLGAVLAARALLTPTLPPLPVLATLPEFRFTDHLGREAGSAQLQGHPWVAGFVFTRCPSTCPALTAHMRDVRDRLAPLGESAQLVSISVDPEHDTTEVLAQWAAKEGISAPAWLAIRGPVEETGRLVRGGFLLALDDTNRADPNALLHDTRLVLVDRRLRIRGFYDSNDPARIEQLIDDVGRLAARDE